jgi:hypothetical protein
MNLSPATHNSNRRAVAIAWERTAQSLVITPTVVDETIYAGTLTVYGPDGSEVGTASFSFESGVGATAADIVTGILADIGTALDTWATVGGTATVTIAMDRGYTVTFESTGAGTLTPALAGYTSQQGTTPADASAWATEAFRIFATEANVDYIVGRAQVVNVDLTPRVHMSMIHHKGLRTADGGAITSRLWSTGNTTHSPGDQVPATPLGLLLEHALGGSTRSNDTAITAVTNQHSVTVAAAVSLERGQIVAFEDAAGKLWPAQILTLSGSDITVDRDQPAGFTLAEATKVHGAECIYPEQAALTNAQDPNYSTVSLLYQFGPHCWMVGGAHLGVDTLNFPRGEQPTIGWTVQAAAGYPPGDGAPSEPTWSGTSANIHSHNDVQAIGRGTRGFLQAYGTTTHAAFSLISASVSVGVPILPQDSVTEIDSGMEGRIGYRTEEGETIIEIVVALDADYQTMWVNGGYFTCTYYQVGPKGTCWAVHLPKAFMDGPPAAANDGTNRWTIRLRATEPDTTSSTTEASKAKIMLAFY